MDVEQAQVNKLLRRGIFFSIVWLAGVGSFIVIRSAMRARRLIERSDGRLQGMGRVWWCLIVGGFGLLVWGGGLLVAIAGYLIHR